MTEQEQYRRKAQAHWDSLGKPIDGLGELERLVIKLCGIQKTERPEIGRRALTVLCADHGCVREGVTQTDSTVTRIVAGNFARGLTTTGVLARQQAVTLFPVDVGMLMPAEGETARDSVLRTDRVNNRRLRSGSGDIAVEPAMSEETGEQALRLGQTLVQELKQQGYLLLLTGEMGIGNTTPTAALFSAFLGLAPEETVGRGAGLSDAGLRRKQDCVRRALRRIGLRSETEAASDAAARMLGASSASPECPLDMDPAHAKQLLFQLGGLEIAVMAGMFLGAVREEMPIVIDGAISTAAALAASRIDPRVPAYALASHVSRDSAARQALRALGLRAILDAELSLGEGSGAVLLLPLLDAALSVYNGMGSFSDIHVEAYQRFEHV